MIWLGLLIADLYLFFVMYVASMGMLRARAEAKLNKVLWALCLPFVALAMLVDFMHNVTVFSVLFAELPKEWLVTERLQRHAKQDTKRGKLARWFGSTILNAFDHTGDHLD